MTCAMKNLAPSRFSQACFSEEFCDSWKSLRHEMRPAVNLKNLSTNSCTKTCEKFEKHNHGERSTNAAKEKK
jgi:hypothetical protein